MTGFLVGFVVGASVVAIVVIIAGPTRRVRAETGIDDEIETRILLGLEPEPHVAPVVEIAHPRDYSPDDIADLEKLSPGAERTARKKRRRR